MYKAILSWDFSGASGDPVYPKAKAAVNGQPGNWTGITSGLNGDGSYDEMLNGVEQVVDALRANPPQNGELRHFTVTIVKV